MNIVAMPRQIRSVKDRRQLKSNVVGKVLIQVPF